MIINRLFCGICFLVLGTGMPLLAKNAGLNQSTPSASSKAVAKPIPAPSPAVLAKAQDRKTSAPAPVILTKDVARGTNTPALVAKTDAPAPTAVRPDAPTHAAPHVERPSSPGFAIHNFNNTLPSVTAIYESDHVSSRGNQPVSIGSSDESSARVSASSGESRLARVTAYWAAEGDYYTERCISSTGVRLHDGHCAVDPSIIPYGSVVEIAGVGKFLAVDTGSAVISRTAAREGGNTEAERHAIVVDLFFEDRDAGEKFAAGAAKYVAISWWTPSSMGIEAKLARSLFAEEDWTKIQGKQL